MGLFFVVMSLVARLLRWPPVRCARGVAQAVVRRLIVGVSRGKARLRAIRVPTALLWGENDSVLPVRWGRTLQRLIPRARMELIPKAGHFPAKDAPRALVASLHRLLGGSYSSSSSHPPPQASVPSGQEDGSPSAQVTSQAGMCTHSTRQAPRQ